LGERPGVSRPQMAAMSPARRFLDPAGVVERLGDYVAKAAGDATSDAAPPESGAAEPKKKRPGHGRNGAADHPRAPHVAVPHATLRHGDPCPV